MSEKFKQLIEERKRQMALQAAQEEAEKTQYADLVPDKEYVATESDKQIDDFIARLGIIDAYNKWCGKSKPQPHGNQREGILVSCPNPWHEDKHPSCWMNLDKKVWVCAKCNMGFRPDTKGGDIYDLAAIKYNMPDYQEGANFRKLREQMAKDFGYTFIETPASDKPVVVAPTPKKSHLKVVEEVPDIGEVDPPDEGELASVQELDITEDELELPFLDWQNLVEPSTFLDEYLKATNIDDIPKEYNLWNGLVGIGLSVGRDVFLRDVVPVRGNLYVCLVGETGDGKSRSFSHLNNLLEEALPFDYSMDDPKGIKIITSPASGEALKDSFVHGTIDPIDPSKRIYGKVRGLIEYDEMSALAGRAAREGNLLHPYLISLYDGYKPIHNLKMGAIKGKATKDPDTTEPARDYFASSFTTAQPRLFKKLFQEADIDSGFMNRWIYATGQKVVRKSIGDVQVDISPAVKPLQMIHGWPGIGGRELKMTDNAFRLWDEFFHTELDKARAGADDDLMARLDLTLKKLMLLFAINELSPEIDVSHVEKALSMFDYLVFIYKFIGIRVKETVWSEMQENILKIVEKRTLQNADKGATLRDLQKLLRRRNYNVQHMERTLKSLVKFGLIKEVVPMQGSVGRPTIRYFAETV